MTEGRDVTVGGGGKVRSRVPKMIHHAPLANRAVRGEQTLARGLAVAAFFFDGEGERLLDFLGILSLRVGWRSAVSVV
eukprot:COSAG01_NODE_7106_length_3351_cov_219.623924_1_plen_78_part_00